MPPSLQVGFPSLSLSIEPEVSTLGRSLDLADLPLHLSSLLDRSNSRRRSPNHDHLSSDTMVVCKCRKATRLYCFVHKVPVCGECICWPEHQICVVKQYSDWVINGEYEWPPSCVLCNEQFDIGNIPQTTRLGCLHLIHTSCLVSHIKSYSPETAPAGYVCPSCSTPLWPPKSIKDTGSCLHSKLKEAIIQSGLEKNVFGNFVVSMSAVERVPPPAFASDPLVRIAGTEDGEKSDTSVYSFSKGSSSPVSAVGNEEKLLNGVYSSTMGLGYPRIAEADIVEIDGPSSLGNQLVPDPESNLMKSANPMGPGATTRKGAYNVERQNSEISYYADDEDGNRKKYTRRGPFRHKFLRLLLPFWSSALPTLPVTAPPRKSGTTAEDAPEGRSRQRSSRMDPRKILLMMAIMACMATMGILYYRLAQGSLGENTAEAEQQ